MDITKTVGYFRVSTPRQAEDGHALERYHQQLIDLGLTEDQIFWDVESGGSADRRGYNAVLDACRTWARFVVVPCFDRFNRSSLLWEQARQEFVALGVEFHEIEGGKAAIDISSPTGILSTQIRAAFAEYERNKNKYASLQGHKFRRQQKKANRACFGYVLQDDKLIINTQPYFDSGKTYQQVAVELVETFLSVGSCSGTIRRMCDRYGLEKRGLPWEDFPRDHSALKFWLSSPVLIGSVVYFPKSPTKREEWPNQHEPLISVEKWQQVQVALSHAAAASRRGRLINPLYGLIHCAGCESPVRVRSSTSQKGGKGKRYNYLICSGAYPQAGKKRVCDRRSSYGWTVERLEDVVTQRLTEKAEAVAGKGLQDSAQVVRTPEMVELEQQVRRYQQMGDPDLADAIRAKQAKLETLKVKAARASDAERLSRKEMCWLASQPEIFWDTAPIEERRGLYLDLIKSVMIDKEEVQVWFKV